MRCTPGTWKASICQNRGVGARGKPTWDINSESRKGFSFVAECGTTENKYSEDDAHLMAASKELLKACEMTLKMATKRSGPRSLEDMQKLRFCLNHAINKAKNILVKKSLFNEK